MIDLDLLRKDPDAFQRACDVKGIDVDVHEVVSLDEKRRLLIVEVEAMRNSKNAASKEIPTLKADAKKEKITAMRELDVKLKDAEIALGDIELHLQKLLLRLPSIPHESVPVGKSDKENVVAETHGDPSTFDFEPKDHVTLGERLDIVDIPRGVKIAGSRSYFLKGDGALLEQALLQFTAQHLAEKGWTVFSPPLMASWEALMGTGFFPGAEEQTYAIGAKPAEGDFQEDNLYLIGTSEVSVASYHKDEVLTAEALPKRYAGISACFRREAGTYGKDTKGLYRVHQFQKVEQVVLCEANEEQAMGLFEEIRGNAEDILKALELPYRVMTVCTGDMGQGKVFMQDIETWMPSRNAYGETHSCSYLGDFQARRLNIKYVDEKGQKRFVHTLNNTCIASPRILIPLLEIYQNADGSITIPEVLRPYMGGQKLMKLWSAG